MVDGVTSVTSAEEEVTLEEAARYANKFVIKGINEGCRLTMAEAFDATTWRARGSYFLTRGDAEALHSLLAAWLQGGAGQPAMVAGERLQ